MFFSSHLSSILGRQDRAVISLAGAGPISGGVPSSSYELDVMVCTLSRDGRSKLRRGRTSPDSRGGKKKYKIENLSYVCLYQILSNVPYFRSFFCLSRRHENEMENYTNNKQCLCNLFFTFFKHTYLGTWAMLHQVRPYTGS